MLAVVWESQTADLSNSRKGVSFLSRIIGNKKKDAPEDIADDASIYSDLRPEGMEAQVFAQPVDNLGFNPRHPQPPAYIRVRAKHKKEKDFDRLFLAQELHAATQGPKRNGSTTSRRGAAPEQDTVWAMQFSRDGRYLAAAGHDGVVRVWTVITNAEERRSNSDSFSSDPEESHIHLSAPVFQSKPVRQFEGHTATILDLSWSKVSLCDQKLHVIAKADIPRTISYFRRPWTKQSDCGTLVGQNVFAPSSITIL